MKTSKILVPTDLSPHANAALRYAVSIAKAWSPADIWLLHVNPGIVPLFDAEYGVLEPERVKTLLKMRAAEYAIQADVPTHELAVHGNPAKKIIETAVEMDVDLIVMGTHGRTGFDHVLMGSVAEAVVRSAPCPVLVMKDAAKLADKRLPTSDLEASRQSAE